MRDGQIPLGAIQADDAGFTEDMMRPELLESYEEMAKSITSKQGEANMISVVFRTSCVAFGDEYPLPVYSIHDVKGSVSRRGPGVSDS